MVFEGGGAKGMVFVGALAELEARGYSPARLIGTSAGSIMATFMAAGYTVEEMTAALCEKQDDQPVFLGFLESQEALTKEEIAHSTIRELLREVNLRFVPDQVESKLDDAIASALASSKTTTRIFSFIERGGFYSAQYFLSWLKAKLNAGIYPLERGAHKQGEPRAFGDMNLAKFHQATGIDLSLVASDTTGSELLIINNRTAPECPVVWAVRMSMSVPMLWNEVVWKEEWGAYRGKNITGHSVVDGGLLSNFPIELFISNQPQVTAVMGEKVADEMDLLGFLIDETLEVPNAPVEKAMPKAIQIGKFRPISRITDLVNTMMQARDKSVIEAFERFVIRLPAKSYGTIEFGMSDERRDALIQAGRQSTFAYLERLEAKKFEVSFGVEDAVPENLAPAADKIATRILS
jgi:predicted acylesterase/phospholipase RssA